MADLVKNFLTISFFNRPQIYPFFKGIYIETFLFTGVPPLTVPYKEPKGSPLAKR